MHVTSGFGMFKQPLELFSAGTDKRTIAYSIKHYIKLLKLGGRVTNSLL
jgi:hypothetical protein